MNEKEIAAAACAVLEQFDTRPGHATRSKADTPSNLPGAREVLERAGDTAQRAIDLLGEARSGYVGGSLPDEAWDKAREDLVTDLRGLQAAALSSQADVVSEPVGWRYRFKVCTGRWGPWKFAFGEQEAKDEAGLYSEIFEVHPLYTSPPKPEGAGEPKGGDATIKDSMPKTMRRKSLAEITTGSGSECDSAGAAHPNPPLDPRVREALTELVQRAWPVNSATMRMGDDTADQLLITPAANLTLGDLRFLLKAVNNVAKAIALTPAPSRDGLEAAAEWPFGHNETLRMIEAALTNTPTGIVVSVESFEAAFKREALRTRTCAAERGAT